MKTIRYNIEIFRTWLRFLVWRIPVNQEMYDMVKEHYTQTPREKAMMKRIAKVNGLEP
jgi:hypothetical protein